MNRSFIKKSHVFLFGIALVLMATPAIAGEKIIFSEVLYDSAVPGDNSGEWIELYNPQSSAVDISDWTISDNAGSFTIPKDTVIYGYCYFVITDSEAYFRFKYGCNPDLARKTVKLGNNGDFLILKNNNGVIIDQVAWESEGSSISGWGSSSKPYANEGKSIRRSKPVTDSDTHSDWNSNNTPQPVCGGKSGTGSGGGNLGSESFAGIVSRYLNSCFLVSRQVFGN